MVLEGFFSSVLVTNMAMPFLQFLMFAIFTHSRVKTINIVCSSWGRPANSVGAGVKFLKWRLSTISVRTVNALGSVGGITCVCPVFR